MGYKKDKLLADRFGHKAGITVYDSKGYDYGLARDDTRNFAEEHISVTENEDGSYPFFTVPVRELEILK